MSSSLRALQDDRLVLIWALKSAHGKRSKDSIKAKIAKMDLKIAKIMRRFKT